MAGVSRVVLPCHSRFSAEQTFAYTPAGYKTRNTVSCSCSLSGKTAENQPPLAADLRLLQLFAHMACSANDTRACMQLIGCCTILLASSPRVTCCAVVSITSKSCCCRLSVAYFVRCAVVFDRSLLCIYLVNCDLSHAAKMSEKPEGDSQTDPMVMESCGSNSSPRGVPCIRGRVTQPPPQGGIGCRPPPKYQCTHPGTGQAFYRMPLCPTPLG